MWWKWKSQKFLIKFHDILKEKLSSKDTVVDNLIFTFVKVTGNTVLYQILLLEHQQK